MKDQTIAEETRARVRAALDEEHTFGTYEGLGVITQAEADALRLEVRDALDPWLTENGSDG